MKVIIKPIFDGKVSNAVCHNLNELCGQKWTKEEIKEILNSADKCFLNEIGRKILVDKSKVNYMTANYILVLPKQFTSTNGEQLYVWIYRNNTGEKFGKINIGNDSNFEYAVVMNHYINRTNVEQS